LVFHGWSIAPGRHAPIDHDFGPGDEARFIGGEKQCSVRGIASVTHESERDAGDTLFEEAFDVAAGALFGEPGFDHWSVQLARNHRVYADAVFGVLHRDHAGELDNARFAGGVSDLRRAAETNS
jgi:hypothetical protein